MIPSPRVQRLGAIGKGSGIGFRPRVLPIPRSSCEEGFAERATMSTSLDVCTQTWTEPKGAEGGHFPDVTALIVARVGRQRNSHYSRSLHRVSLDSRALPGG